MNCGIFSGLCNGVVDLVAPYLFWAKVVLWCVVGGLVLWALNAIKNIAGWPGVSVAIGVLAYVVGHLRGKGGKPLIPRPDNISELEDGPDAEPSPIFRRKPRPKPGKRRRLNQETGNFEDY